MRRYLKGLKKSQDLKVLLSQWVSPLNGPGKFFDKVSTRQNVIDTGCDCNENSVFGVRENIV